MKKEKFIIIDGYGFIFRAYHGAPKFNSPDGTPIGAIYAFTGMMIKLLKDLKPEAIALVLDGGGKNFRHDLYDKYKANRQKAPEDLCQQFPIIPEVAEALGIPIFQKNGYEADDIIATLASKAKMTSKYQITIVSSDKDLMQLIDDEYVKMYNPSTSQYLDAHYVAGKFGVAPQQIRDVLSLMGDSSDNIPGVKSIGPKTAAMLINQFGSLENLLNSIQEIQNLRHRELIASNKENALLSLALVTLDENILLEFNENSIKRKKLDHEKIETFLAKYRFQSLRNRISDDHP